VFADAVCPREGFSEIPTTVKAIPSMHKKCLHINVLSKRFDRKSSVVR
jgi:hypothetical protein